MRIVLDVNILLDVFLAREPFSVAAENLWRSIQSRRVEACLVATTVTTIFYLVRKQVGLDEARRTVEILLRRCDILAVDRATLSLAAAKPMSDFEDAVQDAAAELAGIPILITRNADDFRGSTRRIMDAKQLLAELESDEHSTNNDQEE